MRRRAAGVSGGRLGFGLFGIFVGPVVLAFSYTLVVAWTSERPVPLTEPLPEPLP